VPQYKGDEWKGPTWSKPSDEESISWKEFIKVCYYPLSIHLLEGTIQGFCDSPFNTNFLCAKQEMPEASGHSIDDDSPLMRSSKLQELPRDCDAEETLDLDSHKC